MINRLHLLLLSLVVAIAWILIGGYIFSDGNAGAILFDVNTTTLPYPLTIQNLMWVVFFIGCGELFFRFQNMQLNRSALNANYLPDNSKPLNKDDLINIRRYITDRNDMLAELIKSLITRFQISQNSVEETHQMLNSQLELMQYKVDINYSMIRYIIWLIPTLGFIGTVIGIAQTLYIAGLPGAAEKPDFLSTLTESLSVAFYTTLVALIMSALLVYIMHLIQEAEEKMIQRSGEYCLNNFINKLISK